MIQVCKSPWPPGTPQGICKSRLVPRGWWPGGLGKGKAQCWFHCPTVVTKHQTHGESHGVVVVVVAVSANYIETRCVGSTGPSHAKNHTDLKRCRPSGACMRLIQFCCWKLVIVPFIFLLQLLERLKLQTLPVPKNKRSNSDALSRDLSFYPFNCFFLWNSWRLRQLRTRLVAQQRPVSFRSWRSRRLISGNGSWHGIHLPHGRMAFPVTTSLWEPCHKWQSGGGANGGNGKSMSNVTCLTYYSYCSLKVIYCTGAITLHDFIMTLLNMCPPPNSRLRVSWCLLITSNISITH